MIASRILALTALLALAPACVARAAEPGQCLSLDQTRAAVASHQALPLARAIRQAKSRIGGEIVRARLCRAASGLVYVLTVLARDGKVTRTTIDAASGKLLGG